MLSCPQKLPVEIKIKNTEQMGLEDGNPKGRCGFPSVTESCEHSTVKEFSSCLGLAKCAHLYTAGLRGVLRAPPI